MRVVEQQHADGAGRIRSTLQAAADLREASAAEATAKERELAGREAALRYAVGRLTTFYFGGCGPSAWPVRARLRCWRGQRDRRGCSGRAGQAAWHRDDPGGRTSRRTRPVTSAIDDL